MRIFSGNVKRWTRICFGVILLGIFSLPVSRAAAKSPPQAVPEDQPKAAVYSISIIRYSKWLCVGQKATFTLNFGPTDPLLQPLVSISSIDIGSTINTVEPKEIKPMTNSGAAFTVYTAKHAGTDRVVAILYNFNSAEKTEVSAAQDETTIEVREKCKYHFSLSSEMDVTTEKDGASESISYQIEAEGDLIDTGQPGTLAARDVEVTLWTKITELTIPDCALISQDPGLGTGKTDATARISDDGKSVIVSLGPLRNFKVHKAVVARCGDQTVPVDVNAVSSHTGPLMTDQDFSSAGGTLPVTLDVFERGKKNFESHGGKVSAWALMTLRAVE